tara:strand:+ start:1271 stop:1687 length:417 start_codon:yes stop_codon:yes gene_type:complete
MKILAALCLFISSAHAGQFIEFSCEAPAVSYIFKLEAQGTVELDINNVNYTEAHGWMEATLVDAGFNPVATSINGVEMVGKSRLIEGDMIKPYYHVQLKPVGVSDVQVVNLLLGHGGKLSSNVRLKTGHEYRGKCAIK